MKKLLMIISSCLLLASCEYSKEDYIMTNIVMLPNLKIDDIIIVDKSLRDFTYGDVICFWFEGNDIYPYEEPVCFILRIVALPGDSIAVKDNRCIVNGKENTYTFVTQKQDSYDGINFSINEYVEKLPDGKELNIYIHDTGRETDDMPALCLPADKYFVMGDFRSNAADSRYIGYVDRSSIIGKMVEKKSMSNLYRKVYNLMQQIQEQN